MSQDIREEFKRLKSLKVIGEIMRYQRVIPSIMAKSQKQLDEQLSIVKKFATTVHIDVVDGKFADNKVFRFPFKLKRGFKYNVHLMVERPEPWIKKHFKKFQIFFPHIETLKDPMDYFSWMKQSKKPIAFACLPETKVKDIKSFIPFVDYILILTVHPGFYGGKFLKSQIKKIKKIKKLNPDIKIFVDGGITPKRIEQVSDFGADFFVSGSYIMDSEEPKESFKELYHGWADKRLILRERKHVRR